MKLIKLLAGDRSSTNDVRALSQDRFRISRNSANADIITLDLTRWLEASMLTSITSSDPSVTLAVQAPIVTMTIPPSSTNERVDIKATAADGRVRVIEIYAFASDPEMDYA